MKNIFKYKEKPHGLLVVLFFLFGPLSANSNDSIIGQLGQSLLEQHGRELYNKEYGERPPGWDRRDDDWRKGRGEHRGWDRGKHKGWDKHHKHRRHHRRRHHEHHRHHHPHHHKHHKQEWHKHKGNDWRGREWRGHEGSGKWGRK